MPWQNDPAKRRQDAAFYGSPEYRRGREVAKRRANGRCEGCGCRHDRLQCDHIVHGGSHNPSNLQMLCVGVGSCRCHEKKTAGEGGGGRLKKATPSPKPKPIW